VNNPKLLAAIVYGGREGTPWMAGGKYIGCGPFRITHLNGCRNAMKEIRKQRGGEGYPGWWRCPRRSSGSFGPIVCSGARPTPRAKIPRRGASRPRCVGPLSAPLRQAGVEGCFFATPRVADCWRWPGHPALSLSPAPRWLTFGHAEATRDRTGRLDN